MAAPYGNVDAIWSGVLGVETVTYYPFDQTTDGPSNTGTGVSAYFRDRRKEEVPGPDGGLIFAETCTCNLKRSQLDDAGVTVTKRGQVWRANGEKWAVEGEVFLPATGARVRVKLVRVA